MSDDIRSRRCKQLFIRSTNSGLWKGAPAMYTNFEVDFPVDQQFRGPQQHLVTFPRRQIAEEAEHPFGSSSPALFGACETSGRPLRMIEILSAGRPHRI